MDMKELVEAGERIAAELEALEGKSAAAESDEDKAAATDALEAKSVEWEAHKTAIEGAKVRARRDAVLAEAKALAAVNIKGKSLPIKTVAEPTDHAADERQRCAGFYAYMAGKSVSDSMRTALAPKSEAFSDSASSGVSMPYSVLCAVLGKSIADRIKGKAALTSGGSGQGEENLIPEEYIPEMLRLPGEPTRILQVVNIQPTDTGELTYPRLVQTDAAGEYGGVSMSWIAEAGTKPETKPTFTQLKIAAHELAGHTQISLRMLARSAINLEALLGSLFRDAIYDIVDTALIQGTGVGQPLGVINEPAIRTVARETAGAVDHADLVNLKHAVRAYHRAGARFVLHDTVEAGLEGTVDTTGRPLFSTDVSAGAYERLVGYPYMVTYRTPTLGVSGDIVYGDWSQYTVAMEQDVVVRRSDDFAFTSNVATFIVYMVIGGRPAQPRAFAILDGTS